MADIVKVPLRRRSALPEMLLGENDDDREKENVRQNTAVFTPFKKQLGQDARKRESFNGVSLDLTPKGGRLDPERLQTMYGDCIKLANENKINQKNAWSMNLLDHIRGLAAGSETDFVTAGCTLDAAGKIYSCRVDSVHTETFRVVTGLSRSAQPQEKDGAEEDEEPKDADADSDADGAEEEGKSKKKVLPLARYNGSTFRFGPLTSGLNALAEGGLLCRITTGCGRTAAL